MRARRPTESGSRSDISASLRRAKLLVQSEFGRRYGWFIELDGEVVGELSDCRFDDMFWDSYAVAARDGITAESAIQNEENWLELRFVFRNRVLGEIAERPIPGGRPPVVRDGRVRMRGLYVVPSSRLEGHLVRAFGTLQAWRRRLGW